jgi:hypothetical protein
MSRSHPISLPAAPEYQARFADRPIAPCRRRAAARAWLFPISLALWVALALPAAALVNGVAPDESDTRFDAIAAFSHSRWLGLEPEHSNAKDHNWYGNATLIAPDVVILAKHLIKGNDEPPAGEYAVRFRRNPAGELATKQDPPGKYHNVKIKRFVTAPDADLALGILEEPVEHIEAIALGLDDQALDRAKVLIAGWGSENKFRGVGGPRKQLLLGGTIALRPAGAPVIRFPAGETETRDWREDKETGQMQQKPYVTSEYPVVNLYDSGGPILGMDEEGNVELIGIISTYGGGMALPPAADPDAFPLQQTAEKGAAALADLPFAAK